MNQFDKFSVPQLKRKLWLGSWVLEKLQNDPEWRDDPRAPTIKTKWESDVSLINQALVAKIKSGREAAGISEPPPVVVGLDPLRMSGRAAG